MNELALFAGADGGLRELALFAGAGGGILGGKLLGWRTVCAVEWEPYAASVLVARQNDGLLPPFPIWDDVRTFDGRPWRGVVDVVSGGFPCQDISVAGKGAGIDGERSGMWRHMARIVGEVRPSFVFVENSPALVTRGLGRVLSDLAALGYDCRWTVLGAADVGAPHQRDRFWLVAHACGERHELADEAVCAGRNAAVAGGEVADASSIGQQAACYCGEHGQARGNWQAGEPRGGSEVLAHTERAGLEGLRPNTGQSQVAEFGNPGWWATEPNLGRVAHGVAARMDRLKAIGNGQVPLCAATAWRLLAA